jgi:hypothetical protein
LSEYQLIRKINQKNIKGVIKHYDFKFWEQEYPLCGKKKSVYQYHYIILMELGD